MNEESSDPRARARVDCPRCGERILDVNIFDFAANMTAEQFSVNVGRLVSAHEDTCKPRKRVAPGDAKRRRGWAFLNYGVPVLWAVLGGINLLAGNGLASMIAWLTGAFVLLMKVFEEKTVFQRGYLRGWAEARVGLPILPTVNVHPADRWRRPAGMDDDDGEQEGQS